MTILKLCVIILCFINGHAMANIVVQDSDGKKIVLQKPAQRIISLSPHITELLFAAGGSGHVVGVSKYSDYPEAARHLPVVGDSRELDIEQILKLKPDWVAVWREGSSAGQIAQLQKLGLPLFFSDVHTLNAIPASLQSMGQLMGTENQANRRAAELNQQLAALTKKYAHLSPVRLFYQVWDTPLFTLNGQHIVSDAIRRCGGNNIFSEQKMIAPMVSLEAVLKADPEAIIGTVEGKKNPGEVLAMWKRYSTMTAVKQGNLIVLDGNLINRPGPRMIAGVATLCEKLDQVRQRRINFQ